MSVYSREYLGTVSIKNGVVGIIGELGGAIQPVVEGYSQPSEGANIAVATQYQEQSATVYWVLGEDGKVLSLEVILDDRDE